MFCSQHLLSDSLEPEVLEYKSKSLGYEWRVRDRISVDKFALGVLGHWNHMEGIVGKGSVEQAMTNMAVDLMQYLR